MTNNPGQLALSKANETNGVDLATQDIAKKLEKIIIKVENATANLAKNATANLNVFQRVANKMSTLTKIDPITHSRGIFDFSRSDTILVWLLLLLFAAIPTFALYSLVDGKKSKGKRVRLSIEKKKSRKRAGDESNDEIVSQTENLIRKQPEEEEILLQSDSKSVLPATTHSVIEKSPEKLEVKHSKLPSTVDTTSLDYSSSDVEEKLAEKFKKLKSVTIDEKTVKMKPSKSSFNLGLEKTKDSPASSDKSNKEKKRKSSSSTSSKPNILVCIENYLSVEY
ncbi:uncharacterized protein ACN2A1_008149 [Glossina fuscipes fuscipes]